MDQPQKIHKTYSINQSPLYKLKNKRKLASLLGVSLKELQSIAKRPDNYKIFTINKHTDKSRIVEEPKDKLKTIHYKLFRFLQRIAPPPYLHSGIKKRSYITNAKVHIGSTRCITLDIKKFFPSTLGWHVFDFFYDVLHCSGDVAGLLTSLCTINNHVPTGSCLSQPIAFYAHYKMFEEIYHYTKNNDLELSCYVDDITISGDKANYLTLYKVRGMLMKRGLKSPKKKERVYEIGYPKQVTGSIVGSDQLFLPNRKHKDIYERIKQLSKMDDTEEKMSKLNTVIGKAISASQSDPSFRQTVHKLKQERKRLVGVGL